MSDPIGSSLLCSASRREATTGDRSQESPANAGFLWPLFSSIAPNTSYREPCGLRSSKRVTPCAVVSFSKVATSCIETGGFSFPPTPRLFLPRLCSAFPSFGASKALVSALTQCHLCGEKNDGGRSQELSVPVGSSTADRTAALAEELDHLEVPVGRDDNESDENRYGQASKNDLAVSVEIEKALHVSSIGRRVRKSVQKLYNKLDSGAHKNLRYVQKS